MKKDDQDTDLLETELKEKKNLYSESFKTTNINILLNRVRSDKRKSFRKKITISFVSVSIIIAITAYLIIKT